jgi:hypothetical protein
MPASTPMSTESRYGRGPHPLPMGEREGPAAQRWEGEGYRATRSERGPSTLTPLTAAR